MTLYHGKSGSATFDDTSIAKLTTWTLNTTAEVADTSAFGDSFTSHVIGLTDFTATAEGFSETEQTPIATFLGKSAALVLTNSAGAFTMTAICNSFTETAGIDDAGKRTYSFEGNDADGISF